MIRVRTVTLRPAAADLRKALEPGVTVEERRKAEAFINDRLRIQYLAAHALKRRMLTAEMPDVAPLAWRFSRGPHGKPAVVGHADLHFNLSHCDGMVACAVSRHGPVGVDVECLDRPAFFDVAAAHFAPAEQRWLAAQPAAERAAAFFKLWTLKEAYLKATGLGLALPLKHFAISVDPPAVTDAQAAGAVMPGWRVDHRPVGERHYLAVAWRGGAAALQPTFLHDSLDLLLRS